MAQLLTGNEDVDVKIMLSLTLSDIRLICQTSQYASKLCKAMDLNRKFKTVNKKVDYILSLIDKREYGLKLQTEKEFEPFKMFNDIMLQINIIYYKPYSEVTVDQVINDNVIYMDIGHYDDYFITYHTSDIDDPYSIAFKATKTQLREFLLHLYYNDLMLNL